MTLVTKQLGIDGEKIACEYLSANGFKILHKNFKTKIGEVDIIAEKSKKIHFIEVKTRISDKYKPYESVNSKKINKIKSVLYFYSKINKLEREKFSIDIFSIIYNSYKKTFNLKIFENVTN